MTSWPRSGCSVLVYKQGKILLAKRGKEPFKGCWSLPGGSQEAGETLEECAIRELREETGLLAERVEFATMQDRISRDNTGKLIHHFVLATFICAAFTGTLRPGDDASEVRWCEPDELAGLKQTPDLSRIVQGLLKTHIK